MANRRMFSLKVIDTDEFLDMPQTTQLLYYNLAMRADDDGFIGNPKKIMRISGCGDDDMKVLIAKSFVIPFESGICVIRHWRIHNLIRVDRYCETEYLEEKEKLRLNNGKYETKDNVIPFGNQRETQVRLGKDRLGYNTADKIGRVKNNCELLVDYFFSLKGYADQPKEFYKENNIRYSRFLRPAKQVLELYDGDLEKTKIGLDKLKRWADSSGCEWQIETLIKKYLELK